MISLTVNGKPYQVDVPEDATLLWVIRDHLKLTGIKFGCGIGVCGINCDVCRLNITSFFCRKIKKIMTFMTSSVKCHFVTYRLSQF